MATAVLISGQTRNFRECLPTLHWSVFRKLTDPVFFVSVADDAQAADAYLLEGYYKNVFIERVTQPALPEPHAKCAAHAPYALASSIQGVLRQLWHLERVWKFAQEAQPVLNPDLYIRCRPDLWFQVFRNQFTPANQAATPWWGRFGGCNDRFALLGPQAAAAYFTTFTQIDALLKLGCPLHPESLIRASLENAGMAIDDHLVAEFSIFKDGKRRFPEITLEDLAHHARSLL